MLMMNCLICSGDVTTGLEFHLRCSSCDGVLHYRCGMGYDDPVQAFRRSLGKQQYKCPICIVGSSYATIHKALAAHEKLATVDSEAVVADGEALVDAANGDALEVSQVNGDGHSDRGSHVVSEVESVGAGLHDISNISQHSAIPGSQPRGSPRPRPRTSTVSTESEPSFRNVVSSSELRRVKKCKGMLYSLKNTPSTVETVILLDSNGRDINSEIIDGGRGKICLRSIGGLCCAATTRALKECKIRYPKIKDIYLGLGTNDHLHRREHPGERTAYIKELNCEVRKVFPFALVHFILPFSAIRELADGYITSLAASIKDAGVRWRVHSSPGMKGKLVAPAFIHLTPQGREVFTKWLQKTCAPPASRTAVSDQDPPGSSHPTRPTEVPVEAHRVRSEAPVRTYTRVGPPSVNEFRVHEGDNYRRPNYRTPREEGESRASDIDSMIRDRLFELVMAPGLRRSNYRSRWD